MLDLPDGDVRGDVRAHVVVLDQRPDLQLGFCLQEESGVAG